MGIFCTDLAGSSLERKSYSKGKAAVLTADSDFQFRVGATAQLDGQLDQLAGASLPLDFTT